jgi:transcriptional regulator with XRE-family HTH domain
LLSSLDVSERRQIMRTYGRLREAIKRKFKTLEAFATALNMDRTTLSGKLNGRTGWRSSEIESVCKLLNIPMESVREYFFYD